LKDEPPSGLDCSGDFKAAPDIRFSRAGSRWRLCTAQAAKGQGGGERRLWNRLEGGARGSL